MEEDLVRSCCFAVQGIESKIISWRTYEASRSLPFVEKPPFDPLEEQDSDEETDELYLHELELRTQKQVLENDLLDRHCQIGPLQTSGLIVKDEYKYGDNPPLTSSQIEITEKICHVGTIYISIKNILFASKNAGIILQSVQQELEIHVNEFYLALAILDPAETSLRSLYIWILPFMRKFTCIHIILQELEQRQATGGAILSVLHELSNHGNPNVVNIIGNTFQASKVPFFAMIRNWLQNGEIVDIHDEFFIVKDISSNEMWHSTYQLRPEMIPSIIPMPLAKRILRVGKSIHFLRACCPESFLFDPNQEEGLFSQILDKAILQDDINPLKVLVDFAEKKYNKKAVMVMKQKYNVLDHFNNLKKYILFEQGDFAQDLLSEIAELTRPPRSIPLSLTTNIMSKGLHWENHQLVFRVEMPLHMIFTKEVIAQYQAISQFLWKLKKMEFILLRARQNHPLKRLLHPQLNKIHVSHNLLLRFANDLQFYLMNAIETEWKLFMRRLDSASNLDRIFDVHTMYLSSLSSICLIPADYKDLGDIVKKMCKVAQDFRSFQDSLYNQLYTHQQLVRSRLEPSLESFDIKSKRDFLKCCKAMEQQSELSKAFATLTEAHKIIIK